jgi:hypothetical protein
LKLLGSKLAALICAFHAGLKISGAPCSSIVSFSTSVHQAASIVLDMLQLRMKRLFTSITAIIYIKPFFIGT